MGYKNRKLQRCLRGQGAGGQHRTRNAFLRSLLVSDAPMGALPANSATQEQPASGLGDSPLHVVIVAGVMPLELLLHVVQHDHGRDEVHRLARREQVQVVPTVPAPVPVASCTSRENLFSSEELTNISCI